MDSHMRRVQWQARVQAVEIGKLFAGESGNEAQPSAPPPGMPARAKNGARYVSPSTMLKTLGVRL